ncbi:hypothetical protein GGI21_006750, partial [Coemansia aciculifera]
PDSSMCPQSICALSRPQFWIRVSSIAYVGGDGNSVFGEPCNVNFRDAVSFKLERLCATVPPPSSVVTTPLSAKRVASTDTPVSAAAVVEQPLKRKKSSSANNAPTCPRSNAPHTSRRTSTRAIALPALGDVPFIDDMKSAWECQSLWSILAIQQASIPLMPIHGLSKSQPQPTSTTNATYRTGQDRTLQLLTPKGKETEKEDTLNGLLVPATSGTMDSFEIMDRLYGDSRMFIKHHTDMYDDDDDDDEEVGGSD